MTYLTERVAIERWFLDRAPLDVNIGWDGQPFTPDPAGRNIRLTINNGIVIRESFGQPGANLAAHVGVLQMQIMVPGGTGSDAWRELADEISTIFTGAIMGPDGYAVVSHDQPGIIQFGRDGNLPYVAGRFDEPPFTIITVNAPFTRFERGA